LIAAGLALACVPGAQAQGNFDGVYRAPQGGAGGNTACGTTRFGYPVRVSNGMASMMTVMYGELQGRVAPDGSMRIEQGRALLVGKINGNQFNGTYANGNCQFTLNYTK
jgi:hypothetical protein